MKTLKQLKDALLDEMAQILEKEGYRRQGQSFIRKFELGEQDLHLSLVQYRKDRYINVVPSVEIRFDKVEDMVNALNKRLSKREGAQTATMGAALGHLQDQGWKGWTLTEETDIPALASTIHQEFLQVGKPYLEKYSSYQSALEALSHDDRNAWLHQPFYGKRAQSAVALAVLLGDQQLVKKTIAAKKRYLEERVAQFGGPQDQLDLEKFRQFLSYHRLTDQ